MPVSFTPGSVGITNPISAIDRLPNISGAVSGAVVNFTQVNSRNLAMQRLSRNCRALRGNVSPTNALVLAQVGRNDSMEQLLVRLGAIPIVTYPNPTSLTGYVQAPCGRRNPGAEFTDLAGGTGSPAFGPGDIMKTYAFPAGGAGQPVTATNRFDTAAKGRALIDILP